MTFHEVGFLYLTERRLCRRILNDTTLQYARNYCKIVARVFVRVHGLQGCSILIRFGCAQISLCTTKFPTAQMSKF